MNKDNIKKQGVYAIRNLVNGKMYIGSTANSFMKRWQCHKKRLRHGDHHSPHLQSSWDYYGEENFSFEIVEVTEPEKCREREDYYINLYQTLNPKFGYNTEIVDIEGNTKCSEQTKEKLSAITKQQWKDGLHQGNFKKGVPSWNKGLKCDNISKTRRNMFSSVEVYKDNVLIATFRSVIDLDEWSRDNELPGMKYYWDKAGRSNLGRRTTHIASQNIHRAIRNNHVYRGFLFKKGEPLTPEFGIVKWEINKEEQDDNQQQNSSGL